jgi:FixJ family two-component response regulator
MKRQPVINNSHPSSGYRQDGRPGKPFPLVGLVEGDDSVRQSMNGLLRSADYRTAVFESAEAFLNWSDKHEIGCLVLDVQMPGLSGLGLHRRLAEMKLPIPVIFVTEDYERVRGHALDQGAVAVLPKPCSGDTLLSAIQPALDIPVTCRVRAALLDNYNTANLLYVRCVSELHQRMAVCSHPEYDRLKRDADDVRNALYRAFNELERHLSEHGCESEILLHAAGH